MKPGHSALPDNIGQGSHLKFGQLLISHHGNDGICAGLVKLADRSFQVHPFGTGARGENQTALIRLVQNVIRVFVHVTEPEYQSWVSFLGEPAAQMISTGKPTRMCDLSINTGPGRGHHPVAHGLRHVGDLLKRDLDLCMLSSNADEFGRGLTVLAAGAQYLGYISF